MNSLFSYDSKLMQILMKVGDLMILNICFIFCCLPIVTIGAAQAGLYSGAKVMQDPDDESSVFKAFLKGFFNGIGSITLAWFVFEVALAALVICSLWALTYGSPLWIIIVALATFCHLTCLIPVIHARFSCKWWQLLRNAFLIALAHPIRTFGVLALTWLPVVLFMNYTYYFMMVAPIWLTLYFSTAHLFAFNFMRKPMEGLIEDFKKQHGEDEEEIEEEPVAATDD